MEITGKSLIWGVIGYPIKHSLSPVFQNEALKWAKIEGVYIPFEVKPENFQIFVEGLLKMENFRGFNITVPFKEKIIPFGNYISEEVKEIGSANTLKKSPKGIELYNTDWIGFLKALKDFVKEDLKNKKILILGAGGTTRAVLYALKKEGVKEIYLWNRTEFKALQLAEKFSIKAIKKIEANILEEVDIIVNTTSVGLKEDDPPLFDYNLFLKPKHYVYDVIYKETPLIKYARKKGAKAENGLKMLLYQGIESFKIWHETTSSPPLNLLLNSVKKFLNKSQ
jgi:shikimate dehydrogenase